ncbi:beta-1,6-N-acetylglucosaminyltransferase [Cytobacillus sp. Hz8]|uniref:beta-1,6-N-acetylglucosaminyltransferase n=1 Tax=Cytobacillus sp. Hz8 TaxID=3347168 RepID=UPI0035E15109
MNAAIKTAYILQIHKNPHQVNQFIKQLISTEQADIFVHIDKNNDVNVKDAIIKDPHVYVLKQSISCEWGDISQIDTTLLLLREVIATKHSYDFVCLRSGQDLLVKEGFMDFLRKNTQHIYMTINKMEKKHLDSMLINWPKITRGRYDSIHPIRVYRTIIRGLFRLGIRVSPNVNQWPKNFSFYTGSQWFTIPFEVAKYIIQFIDDNSWFYQFFKNTLVPDQWFFQTLIMNSPYYKNVVNNNLMYLDWGDTISTRNSPKIITMRDVEKVEKSNQYFARKFDEKIDPNPVYYFTSKVKFGREEEQVINYRMRH